MCRCSSQRLRAKPEDQFKISLRSNSIKFKIFTFKIAFKYKCIANALQMHSLPDLHLLFHEVGDRSLRGDVRKLAAHLRGNRACFRTTSSLQIITKSYISHIYIIIIIYILIISYILFHIYYFICLTVVLFLSSLYTRLSSGPTYRKSAIPAAENCSSVQARLG